MRFKSIRHMLIACLATLKLAPRLPTKVALAQFPDVQHAVDAVQEILRTPYGNNIRMHRVDLISHLHYLQVSSQNA